MKFLSIAATAASSLVFVSSVSGTPVEHVRRQQQTNPELYVTGPRTGGVQPRLPIQELQSREADQFNMFMLALYAMERVPETNASSYYQLAGIHGRPHIPWNEPSNPSQNPDYGYCTHGSALFATWHRPYISLVEQRLNFHARQEAARFSGNNSRRYRDAAEKLRLPYWDWATGGSAIPSVVMQPTVTVTRAGSNGQPRQTSIPNPLYQYTFTDNNLKNRFFTGIYRTAQYTLRQPSDIRTSRNNVADQAMRAAYVARRQNTYNLFSIPTFREFSSTAFSPGGVPNGWVSIESVHNQVHSSTGGTTPGLQGHMSLVDYSSFDPIFWLHHVNVDRLTAMYQATHPGQVVTPQAATPVFSRRITPGVTQDTIDTPLWPFRKSSGNYYTSRDVSAASSIWDLGYSYPEVPASYRGRPNNDLRSFVIGRVNSLYSPSAVSQRRKRLENVKRREWLCHFVFIPAEVGAVAELDIYFGNTSLTDGGDDTYIGGGGALGRDTYTDLDKNMKVTGVVPLTAALEEQGIDTDNIPAVVKHLADGLKWKMKKGDGSYDLDKLKSLKVGVSSSDVSYGSTQELPEWGDFETYYEITDKKKCGMTSSDSKIVGSKKAPLYLSGDEDEKKGDDNKDDNEDDKKDE